MPARMRSQYPADSHALRSSQACFSPRPDTSPRVTAPGVCSLRVYKGPDVVLDIPFSTTGSRPPTQAFSTLLRIVKCRSAVARSGLRNACRLQRVRGYLRGVRYPGVIAMPQNSRIVPGAGVKRPLEHRSSFCGPGQKCIGCVPVRVPSSLGRRYA
ncbi:hypothetical protein C8Q78DRAFT_308944 [Trametes maxima]|nr:hypothetical protein C8Q78DRAFT_308944 [Trametes maxima]